MRESIVLAADRCRPQGEDKMERSKGQAEGYFMTAESKKSGIETWGSAGEGMSYDGVTVRG